jgi:hypothetical protein
VAACYDKSWASCAERSDSYGHTVLLEERATWLWLSVEVTG